MTGQLRRTRKEVGELGKKVSAAADAQVSKDKELSALKGRVTKLENALKGEKEAPEAGAD